MKYLIILFVLVIPIIGLSQEDIKSSNLKDTVLVDSVTITDRLFCRELDKFYKRIEEVIDTDSYFVIFISHYAKDKPNTFLIDISLRDDLENYMQNLRANVSGYFVYKKTIVLIPVLYEETGLFIRTGKKKLVFNHKESNLTTRGLLFTHIGYKLKITKSKKTKIIKKYYLLIRFYTS